MTIQNSKGVEIIATLHRLDPATREVVCALIDREKDQARAELMASLPLVNWRWFTVSRSWPKQLGRRGAKVGLMAAIAGAGLGLTALSYLLFPWHTLLALCILGGTLGALVAFVGFFIAWFQFWDFLGWVLGDVHSDDETFISYHLERWFPKASEAP